MSEQQLCAGRCLQTWVKVPGSLLGLTQSSTRGTVATQTGLAPVPTCMHLDHAPFLLSSSSGELTSPRCSPPSRSGPVAALPGGAHQGAARPHRPRAAHLAGGCPRASAHAPGPWLTGRLVSPLSVLPPSGAESCTSFLRAGQVLRTDPGARHLMACSTVRPPLSLGVPARLPSQELFPR